jgi:hypothetical protein
LNPPTDDSAASTLVTEDRAEYVTDSPRPALKYELPQCPIYGLSMAPSDAVTPTGCPMKATFASNYRVLFDLSAKGFNYRFIEHPRLSGPAIAREANLLRLFYRPGHYEEDTGTLFRRLRQSFGMNESA